MNSNKKNQNEPISDLPNHNDNAFTDDVSHRSISIRYYSLRLQKAKRVKRRRFKEPSELVPDQTFTVRQIFERAVCNSMPVNSKPFYAEDTNDINVLFSRSGIDLSTLDLTELQDYHEQLNEQIKLKKHILKSAKNQQDKKIDNHHHIGAAQ